MNAYTLGSTVDYYRLGQDATGRPTYNDLTTGQIAYTAEVFKSGQNKGLPKSWLEIATPDGETLVFHLTKRGKFTFWVAQPGNGTSYVLNIGCVPQYIQAIALRDAAVTA